MATDWRAVGLWGHANLRQFISNYISQVGKPRYRYNADLETLINT